MQPQPAGDVPELDVGGGRVEDAVAVPAGQPGVGGGGLHLQAAVLGQAYLDPDPGVAPPPGQVGRLDHEGVAAQLNQRTVGRVPARLGVLVGRHVHGRGVPRLGDDVQGSGGHLDLQGDRLGAGGEPAVTQPGR